MSLLFKHLRIHQIFGANTDVGKTLITTALIRASVALGNSVFYLKPVSTGRPQDADDSHVSSHLGRAKHQVQVETLFRYQEPVSPHLAAQLQSEIPIPSDETLTNAIAAHIRKCASKVNNNSHMYVETAGGVHSPTSSGITQADSYRTLFMPTVLVGDSQLGGISSTISAYESLLLRGYIIDAILVFQDSYFKNWEYLKPYFAERGISCFAIQSPPDKLADAKANFDSTERYYERISSPNISDGIFDVVKHLDGKHSDRISELDSMARRSRDVIWWPFVQHQYVLDDNDVTVIDSAFSDFFSVLKSPDARWPLNPELGSILQPQLDGSASWWTQTFGHAPPSLTLAAARASGRYGHVMFPQATHLPALRLAESLVHDGPGRGWASRAFFSDDGSTGMEVALKMALRAFVRQKCSNLENLDHKQLGILGLKGSYHGDTIGAMDACEEGVYTCEWHKAKGFWFEPPVISIQRSKPMVTLPSHLKSRHPHSPAVTKFDNLSDIYNVQKRLDSSLSQIYQDHIVHTLEKLQQRGGPTLAALVIEPLLMGAGGMIFVDPLFQRVMVDIARKSFLPVIFDEVFVGLYRVGLESTAPLLGVQPDISVHAKMLTGGLIPLAVTLTSDSIFQAFLGDSKTDALLHGHSYTAHPVGCEVANETLKIIRKLSTSEAWIAAQRRWMVGATKGVWSFWDPGFVHIISQMPIVQEVMTLGTVLVVTLRDDQAGYTSMSAQTLLQPLSDTLSDQGTALSSAPGGGQFGVHFRTLGNVAYFMTSLNTPLSTTRAVEDKIWRVLQQSCSSSGNAADNNNCI